MTIIKLINQSRSCNECGVVNFDSKFGKKTNKPIYEVVIGSTCIALCEDCLKAFIENANRTMSE